MGTPVSLTNKTDYHDISEILLKVALKTTTPLPLLIFTSTITYNKVRTKRNLLTILDFK
jgi:hypothetical protein